MNRSIPESVVEEIRSRIDIVELINEYVPLKKKGRDWEACCPFHTEKTPSFKVSQEKQMYYCYGCGAGGDLYKFIMAKENMDFPMAVNFLAAKCNVIIPENNSGNYSYREKGSRDLRDRLYKLHDFVAKAYTNNLFSFPDSAVGRYVKNRKLSLKGVKSFELGASLGGDDIIVKAQKAGFTVEELLQSGIGVKSPRTGKLYDRFFNRLVFPIWDETGRVIGFSSRTVEENQKSAKYVNSPESVLFKKKKVLYGISKARKAFGEKQFAIMCEGQLDVMAMHLAGFENTVAPQGTAFTDEQCRILKRYSDKLYIMFDADAAGQKAVRRALEIALPVGFDIKVVKMPANSDPDEIYKREGVEGVQQLIDSATDFFDYLIDYYRSIIDASTPAGKGQIVKEMIPFIRFISNSVTRSAYVVQLAGLFAIPEEAIFNELNKHRRQQNRFAKTTPATQQEQTVTAVIEHSVIPEKIKHAEKVLFKLALEFSDIAERLTTDLLPEMLSESAVAKALDEIVKLTMNGEHEFIRKHLIDFERNNPNKELLRLLMDESDIAKKSKEKALNDSLKTIKLYALEQKRDSLMKKLREAKSVEQQQEIFLQYCQCEAEIKEFQ